MSLNKKRKQQNKPDIRNALHIVRSVFVAREGGLRAVWRLLIALGVYVVWTNGITIALSYAFDALFSAWSITTLNVQYAPGYARWFAANYGNVISVVSSVGVAVFAYLAAPARDRLRFRPKLLGIGTIVGGSIVLVAALCMLALDSVRTPAASPDFTWSPVVLLPVYLAAAVAEEFFARGYVRPMIATRAHRPVAYLASAAVFLYITGGYALGVMGIINLLLFSVVLCALSERWSSWLTAGVRFGWGYAVTCLFAFPGANGGNPIVPLYSVSEEWLTGGKMGLISGAYMTILLLAALIVLFRATISKGTKIAFRSFAGAKRHAI